MAAGVGMSTGVRVEVGSGWVVGVAMSTGVGAEVGSSWAVGVAMSTGDGAGVGVGDWPPQATSSAAPKARRKGQRKNITWRSLAKFIGDSLYWK